MPPGVIARRQAITLAPSGRATPSATKQTGVAGSALAEPGRHRVVPRVQRLRLLSGRGIEAVHPLRWERAGDGRSGARAGADGREARRLGRQPSLAEKAKVAARASPSRVAAVSDSAPGSDDGLASALHKEGERVAPGGAFAYALHQGCRVGR